MSVVRAVSVRRNLSALAMAGTLAVAVVGAGPLSSTSQAAARATPSPAVAGPAVAGPPVSVPDDVPFTLDAVPVTIVPDVAAGTAGAGGGSVQRVAAATLAELPASAGVGLVFDPPQLRGHLGGVMMDSPGSILISASRLAGDPGRAADVVRHEIAHIYQARLATTLGLGAVRGRMVEIFGPGGLERAADCVALALGATWTHYTSDCAGADRAAAVDALIAGRMP